MKFSFASSKLKKQLSVDKELNRTYGQRAKKLKLRLNVLSVAKNLSEIPNGPPDRCHQLTGNRSGQFAVTVKDNWRLIFEPAHDPVPVKEDGSIDLKAVTEICILEVVDYHGN